MASTPRSCNTTNRLPLIEKISATSRYARRRVPPLAWQGKRSRDITRWTGDMDILFVTATRIGDAMLSTGLLSYLTERHAGARLTIAAGPVAAPLFAAVPKLERLIVMRKRPFALHWLGLYGAVVGRRWDLSHIHISEPTRQAEI